MLTSYPWQFNGVAWLYLASAVISFFTAYESRRMRQPRGAREFTVVLFLIGIWCTGYLLGFFNSDLRLKLIFLRVEYFGIISSSYAWFLFAVRYVNSRTFRSARTLAALALVPFISFILVLIIPWNHLFYTSYGIRPVGSLMTLHKTYGPAFYIEAAYSYMLVVGGMLLLLSSVHQMPNPFRRQVIPIGIAVVLILMPNFLYVSGSGVFGIYDPTPISFALGGLLINFTMTRYKFLDVVPTAYGEIFRSVESGIIIVDDKLRVTELNPAAEKILSIDSGRALGKGMNELCPECSVLFSEISERVGKKEIQIGNDKRIYSASLSPLRNERGEFLGGIVLLYDVTELHYALNEIDTYAHTVAHDLKAPLSLLTGFSEILMSDGLSEVEKNDALDVIKSYSAKMIRIVDDLLTLASVRRQKEIEFEVLDMAGIVKSALHRLGALTQEKKGSISQPKRWPDAVGYAAWLEEVWVNYISNALKYGGPSPSIRLGADEGKDFVTFWVQDSGLGLSEYEQSKLFKEFSKLPRPGEEPGHGLGLFTVSRIISRLGGEAGVESQVGRGAKFYFTLPKA